ncbi:uncharacterized protein LOC134061977 isoform X4 [Sardina pilchardus]|uniref:uncharacterized protein LOC134061977 isoform X4 n=1 Tax=Sardina pilchardus TaxID=27697 RepID=UPI002E11B4CF
MEGRIDEILWKNKGNKMVEWDSSAEFPTEYLTFQGRTKLDIITGKVTITNLTKDDSGDYEVDVLIDETLRNEMHHVEVIDPVTEVKITCASITIFFVLSHNEDYRILFSLLSVDAVGGAKVICQRRSATVATLHCEAEGDFLSFSWSGPGLQTEMRGQTGPQITKEKDQDSVYTCVVNNPVSNSSVAYQAADCFASDAGNLQLIIGVACSAAIGVAAAAAGFGYCCYKKSTVPGPDQVTNPKAEEEDQASDPLDAGNENRPFLPSEGEDDAQGSRDEGKAAENKIGSGPDQVPNPKAEEEAQASDPSQYGSAESIIHMAREEETKMAESAGAIQPSDDETDYQDASEEPEGAQAVFKPRWVLNHHQRNH